MIIKTIYIKKSFAVPIFFTIFAVLKDNKDLSLTNKHFFDYEK